MALPDYDALVVGAGVAGATTALLLAHQGLRVCVIDQRNMVWDDSPSNRVVAISLGSEGILKHAGIWSKLPTERLAPYQQMQVEAKNQVLHFRADEHGLPLLGTIVEIPLMEAHLLQCLTDHPEIDVRAPVQWHDFDASEAGIALRLLNDRGDVDTTLTAMFLVAADGAKSGIREAAGIEHTVWDYNQQALIGPVVTERFNAHLAWQRFTELGPLALLPLPDGRSSVVWSIPKTEAGRLANVTAERLVAAMNEAIEASGSTSPLGRIQSIEAPQWLPLTRQRAHALVRGRVVLVGDAAHSVHPLAGQGLNLGLADAAALAQCFSDYTHTTPSLKQALNHYQRWRLSHSTIQASGIHWINELQRLPMGLGRWGLGVSLRAADTLWPIRHALIERASGIDRDSPDIARS